MTTKTATHGGVTATWTPITLTKSDGKWWTLADDLHISLSIPGIDGVWHLRLGSGWQTDLGSVPQRLQGIANPGTSDDDLLLAYLVHDAWYEWHFSQDRQLADEVLRRMVTGCDGVDPWDPWLIYGAVRLAGSAPWNSHGDDVGRADNSFYFDWSNE